MFIFQNQVQYLTLKTFEKNALGKKKKKVCVDLFTKPEEFS